jgi:hypothetical protein
VNVSLRLDSPSKKAALAAGVLLAAGFCLLVVKWAFGHAVAMGATEAEVAALGRSAAGRDPHASFAHGLILEKTLLPQDEERAYAAYSEAASLSPRNYIYWLAVGRSRERAGDVAGAEHALRKAKELAPAYARVSWALGNFLLREGKTEEAFAEIRSAAAADPSYAGPAASGAWLILGRDVSRLMAAVGDSPRIRAAAAVILAGEGRHDEAVELWNGAAAAAAPQDLTEPAKVLFAKLVEAEKFRQAIDVGSGAGILNGISPEAVANPGFEEPIASTPSIPFGWAVPEGTFPRIGLNESQKVNGRYSLLISFGQGGKGARNVAQRLGVAAGGRYELKLFFLSQLKPDNRFRVQVLSGGEPLAEAILPSRGEWSEARLGFSVPAGKDGVELRFSADGCTAESCPVAGNIWLDDIELVRL